MAYIFNVALRLFVAVLLGGFIGAEREHTNRPAGFRTYILVCVGSALVMVTSEFIFDRYREFTNLDPARLGAQVISGIGFLGAGTIIREGFTVRGLTTAASLWAVSCVGLAAGIGFYSGAILATFFIFITLIFLKKLEQRLLERKRYKTITLESENLPDKILAVKSVMEKYNIEVKDTTITKSNENTMLLKVTIKLPGDFLDLQAISDLQEIAGVKKIYED